METNRLWGVDDLWISCRGVYRMEISIFHPVLAFLTPTAAYFQIIRSNRIICATPTHLG